MHEAPEPNQIDSWQKAEENAAAWMRHWGFSDARVTPACPDGGIDVVSANALAQVKFEAAQVGAPAVQRLVGARGRDHHKRLFFFSGAGFAAPAIYYADDMDIALFKFGMNGDMTPMNATARDVIALRSQQAVGAAAATADSLTVPRQPFEVVKTKTNSFARNWPAGGAALFAVGTVYTTIAILNGTDDPHITWADPIRNALLMLPFLALWLWSRKQNPFERTTTTTLVDAPTEPKPTPVGLVDPRTLPAVMDLLREGKVINAIKEYRDVTGVGLKEAKDAVEGVAR